MKNSLKKATSAFLALVMCFSLIQIPALADNDSADEMQGEDSIEEIESIEVVDKNESEETISFDVTQQENNLDFQSEETTITYKNPLYGSNSQVEANGICAYDTPSAIADNGEEEGSLDFAITTVREAMVNREGSVTVWVGPDPAPASDEEWIERGKEIYNNIIVGACTKTDKSDEGDYLVAHFDECNVSYSPSQEVFGSIYYEFNLDLTYYTDAEQEQQVTEKTKQVLSEIITDDMNDYEKICAIYHYITYNVKYDDDGAKQAQENPGTEDILIYTAYNALIKGTAVCQGYASLFYRMAMEAGIDCRFVCGHAGAEDHAWDIVKIGDNYYNVDSTWDSTWYATTDTYNYFMRGNDNFTDHVADDSEWIGSPWTETISSSDYSEDIIYHDIQLTDTTATCGKAGEDIYSCVICGEDGYTIDTPATGNHTWEKPVFDWADDNSYASAARTCSVCGETEDAVEISIEAKTENCETIYTATATFENGDVLSDTKTIASHEWGEDPVFSWSEDMSSCVATFACTKCGDTIDIDADVSSEIIKEATCTEAGEANYTATVEFNEKLYSNEKPAAIPPLGHEWNEPNFVWNSDFSDASVTRTCQVCGVEEYAEHVEITSRSTEPNCTKAGAVEYTATAYFSDDSYTNTVTIETEPALGHEWGEPKWTWSDDGTVAIATFTCTRCDEVVSVDAAVTNETIKEATCTENGTILHTATVEFNDDTYTDSMETTIQASGHSWTATETVESENSDKTVIEVNMVCMNCGEEKTGTVVFNTTGSNVNSMSSYSWSSLIGIQSLANYIADNSYVEFEILVEPSSTTSSAVENKIDELYNKDEWKHDTSYLNIVITMNVYDENDKLIDSQTFSETTDPIDFTIDIPEELLGDEEYALIRVHDGVAEQIDFENNADGTLSFSSDKFSTYAVVGLTAIQDDTGTETSNPDSKGDDGDNNDNNGDDSGSGTSTGAGDGTSDNGTTASNDGATTSTDSTESANGTTATDNGGKEDTSGGKEAAGDVKTGDPSIALFCTAGILLAACGTLVAATQHRRKEENN